MTAPQIQTHGRAFDFLGALALPLPPAVVTALLIYFMSRWPCI
jgi:hypothetical protein